MQIRHRRFDSDQRLSVSAGDSLALLAGRSPHLAYRPEQIDVSFDDVVSTQSELQQKSWNWRSIFGGADGSPFLVPVPNDQIQPKASPARVASAAGALAFRLICGC